MIDIAQDYPVRALRNILGPVDPAAQVVFFPYAGGNSWAASGLAASLPADWSLAAVQYPGRGSRMAELGANSVEEIARSVLAELPAVPPMLLFGHSFGAYVALETARLLASDGRPARLLVVSAASPPGESADAGIHLLDDEELLDLLVSRGGTPAELLENEDLMQLILPAIRWDFRLAKSYSPVRRPVPTPIVAIGGSADTAVPAEKLACWQWHTERWLGCRLVPGGHFYYLTDPHVVTDALIAGASFTRET